MAELKIVVVDTTQRKQRQTFIDLPKRLYQADPAWVAPLDLEQHELITAHNPFFRHGSAAFWLAYLDGAPVGRISAQVDALYMPRHGRAVGYFGLFECINDAHVAAALFKHAEAWLRQRECTVVHGPFNLSINQSCGLLIEGHQSPPYMMMGHALPYYPKLLASLGYQKEKDLLAYATEVGTGPPPIAYKLQKRFAAKVKLSNIKSMPRAQAYALLRDIFNDAWNDNWGFVPFTEEEFTVMGKSLNLIMDPRQAQLAYVDGEAVGMMVTLPDVNEAIRGLNGKLLPFGWARLLWRLKVKRVSRVRVPLMGVRRHLHGAGLAGGVAFMMLLRGWELSSAAGYQQAEMSWILEDNTAIKDVIERVGGRVHKRYRVYQKDLSNE